MLKHGESDTSSLKKRIVELEALLKQEKEESMGLNKKYNDLMTAKGVVDKRVEALVAQVLITASLAIVLTLFLISQ